MASRRIVGVLALLPLLVVAVAAPALAMRCRTTGAMMALCACPAASSATDPGTPTIGGQTCCELHRVDTVRTASEPPSTRALLATDPVATEAVVVLEGAPPRRPIVALARPPAHGRPPVLLTKTVLLL